MSSAIAFASEKVSPDNLADVGVSELLDAVAAPDLDLPCRSGDVDLWFAEAPAELDRAKRFCADCPVREACLAGALARREPWGVWGGEIFERGTVVARKRPRGRPRKHPVTDHSTADHGTAEHGAGKQVPVTRSSGAVTRTGRPTDERRSAAA